LRSLSNVNIRISAKPPTNSSPSYSIPSSPIPPSDSSSIAGSLPLGLQSRPPITVQIPGASTVSLNVNGPLSPPSYQTARSTPLSERPPAAEPSPRSQAPLFPELQFTLSAHPTSARPRQYPALLLHRPRWQCRCPDRRIRSLRSRDRGTPTKLDKSGLDEETVRQGLTDHTKTCTGGRNRPRRQVDDRHAPQKEKGREP